MRKDLRKQLYEEIILIFARKVKSLIERLDQQSLNESEHLNERFDWRRHFQSLIQRTPEFIYYGNQLSKNIFYNYRSSNKKWQMFDTVLSDGKVYYYIFVFDNVEDIKTRKYSTIYVFLPRYVEYRYGEGWSSNVIEISNNKIKRIFVLNPTFVNLYIDAHQLNFSSNFLELFKSKDEQIISIMFKRIIKDLLNNVRIEDNISKKSLRHSSDDAGFGWSGRTIIALFVNSSRGFGYSNDSKTYIMLNRYVSRIQLNLYKQQREEKNADSLNSDNQLLSNQEIISAIKNSDKRGKHFNAVFQCPLCQRERNSGYTYNINGEEVDVCDFCRDEILDKRPFTKLIYTPMGNKR